MLKKLINRLFGSKLPCGHGKRIKAVPGTRANCDVCNRSYLMATWLC